MSSASSEAYWNRRYRSGRGSGRGSRGDHAQVKADYVNRAVAAHNIGSILDLGCGDGYVAALIEGDYLGVDPSPYAVALARIAAPQHKFFAGASRPREGHLSLDVIRHLVHDEAYRAYMASLFSATKAVMVWSSDVNRVWSEYERERRWTPDVADGWRQVERSPSVGGSRFYVYLAE